MTSPASGASAPRRRLTQRLIASSVIAATLGVLLVVGAAPAAAARETGVVDAASSPSPTAASSGGVELILAPGSNGVLRAGQSLDATAVIDNPAASAAPATRIELQLGDASLPDRASLQRWLNGDGTAAGFTGLTGADAGSTDADSRQSVALSVGGDNPALAGRGAGVYPLRATATVDGTALTAESVVVVPADGAAPVPLGAVVPITAGAAVDGVIDADTLTALTSVGGELTALLDAVDGTEAILAVDPAVVASIRVLGTAAPTTALDWLDRLLSLPNSRFALQYGDADLAVQLQAGLAAPLQPTSLRAYMAAANFAGAAAVGAAAATAGPDPAPTETQSPDGVTYPDLATLLDIGRSARLGAYWPATNSAGAEVAASLGALGVDGAPSLTLVSSASTAGGGSGATVPARATAGDAQLLVYDSAASTSLHAASGIDEASERAASLVAATAALTFASTEAAGRPLLVTVDRGEERSSVALRAAITAAFSAPGVAPAGLDDLVALAPEPVQIAEIPADAARVDQLAQLVADEAAVGQFATILDDPAMLTGPERAEILQLAGVAWRADASAAADAVSEHRAATATTLDSVGILSTSFILASTGGDWRPYVRNDLGYAVNVELLARPDDLGLVVQERTAVRASANSNTRVEVPVQSQVGNGNVQVSMQLYSPTGVAVGAGETASVEVHAEWETIGLAVLGALMVLFLVGGVIRTVRRRRTRRAEQEAAEPDAAETQHPGDPT